MVSRRLYDKGEGWFLLAAVLVSGLFLLPVYLGLSFDEEDIRSAIFSTWYQYHSLLKGYYPFWTSLLGLGMPQPFAQNFVFHPLGIIFGLLPLPLASSIFIQAHYLVGSLALWGLCRKFDISPPLAAACVVTWVLATPSLNYMITDFWPTVVVVWSLFPVALWLSCRLLESEDLEKKVWYSLLFALTWGIIITSGHLVPGVLSGLATTIFLLANGRVFWRRLPWFLAAAGVSLLLSAAHIYDLQREYVLFPPGFERIVRTNYLDGKELWAIFLRPLWWGTPGQIWRHVQEAGARIISFGGIFAALAFLSALWPKLESRYRWALWVAFVLCFLGQFLPGSFQPIPVISWYFLFRDPTIVFGILLAGLALQRWVESKRRYLAWGLCLANLAMVAGGALPLWAPVVDMGLKNLRSPQPMVSNVFKETDLVKQLKHSQAQVPGRIYFTWGVDSAVWSHNLVYRGVSVNSLAYHELPVVNGYFKGIYLEPLHPAQDLLHSWIFGQKDAARHQAMLDVLGIRYVLAFSDERVASGLVAIHDFGPVIHYPGKTLVLYENPGAWPPAVVMRTSLAGLQGLRLPRRTSCQHDRLFCADFSPLLALRDRQAQVEVRQWPGGMELRLAPASTPRTMLLAQMYRPAWQAIGYTSDGRESPLPVRRVVEALTGLAVPPGVERVVLRYRPQDRMVITAISWGGWLACYVIVTLLGGRVAFVSSFD